jgi:hypothetical protein
MTVDLPDWLPTWSDVTGWWAALTADPERLAVLALIVLVVVVLLRWLLRSWLGRILLVVAAVVVWIAATGRGIG